MPTEWTRMHDVLPTDMLNPLPARGTSRSTRKDRPLRAWAAHLEFRADRMSSGGY
jgi:hypothetical protein